MERETTLQRITSIGRSASQANGSMIKPFLFAAVVDEIAREDAFVTRAALKRFRMAQSANAVVVAGASVPDVIPTLDRDAFLHDLTALVESVCQEMGASPH